MEVQQMRNWLTYRTLAAAAATTLIAAFPATATASPDKDPSTCSAPTLTQPFLGAKDKALYTLVEGQTADGFNGEGWTLSGGASIVPATLDDGTTTTVLDLPSGATAISPEVCITKDFPKARTMVRTVGGDKEVEFYVSHLGTDSWEKPKRTGHFHGKNGGWTLSDNLAVQPADTHGRWNIARFKFVADGTASDFQMYDFYVDPRMR